MTDPLESRIIIRRDRRGKAVLSLWSPHDRRHISTGITAGPRVEDIEQKVLQVKGALEEKGLRVTFSDITA